METLPVRSQTIQEIVIVPIESDLFWRSGRLLSFPEGIVCRVNWRMEVNNGLNTKVFMEEIENVNVSTTNLTVNTKLRFRVHGVRNLLDRWAIGRIVWKREDVAIVPITSFYNWSNCMGRLYGNQVLSKFRSQELSTCRRRMAMSNVTVWRKCKLCWNINLRLLGGGQVQYQCENVDDSHITI